MFRFFPVWLTLRGFHIHNFYHLTPCWSRSLSCIHSIVIICRRTLNQNAFYKALFQLGCHLHIPNQEIRFCHWNHDRIAQYYKKKIMKRKCHETHSCLQHKYDYSRKKTRSRKKFAVVTRKYFQNLRKCNTAIPRSIHTVGRI